VAAPAPVLSCADWVQRAVANPDIDVEKVPEPVAMDPPPFPKSLGKDARAELRFQVLVDTLGKPDMTTFKIVKSSNAAVTKNIRTAVAKWKFRPAEINGCKVPRTYHLGATAGKRPVAK
jgi:hypothetical protein